MNDLISVILPVYNGEAHLEEAIKSILAQTYKEMELIIINDASTDGSLSIANKFRIYDKRVRVISNQENLSLPKSLNIGHAHAKGEYLTWTSHDNILKPHFLEKLYHYMISVSCDVVFSNYDIIWQDGEYKRSHTTGPVVGLIFGNTIGASFLYKKEVFEEVNGYREDLFLVEDYFFFLKASLFFKFSHLNENLYQYRLHQNSLSYKIDSNPDYEVKYDQALNKMFSIIEEELGWSNNGIKNFILDLTYKKKADLEWYLRNKKNLKFSLMKYQNRLHGDYNGQVQDILKEKIRAEWQRNSKLHTLNNLGAVLLKERELLLVNGFNKFSTVKLVLSCFKNSLSQKSSKK